MKHLDDPEAEPIAPPAALYERLSTTLSEVPAPRRRTARLRWAPLLILPALAIGTLAVDAATRHHALVRSDGRAMLRMCGPTALALLLLALVMTFIALSRGRDSLGES